MTVNKSLRIRFGMGLFFIALFSFSGVLGGNLYQIIVEVPNWSANIPESLVIYRQFHQVSHAGYFFQTLVPLTVICLIVSTILLWNRPKEANTWLLVSLAGVLIAEIFTLLYFLPRNIILFFEPLDNISAEKLKRIGSQWTTFNYVRMIIVFAAMGLILKTYKVAGQSGNTKKV